MGSARSGCRIRVLSKSWNGSVLVRLGSNHMSKSSRLSMSGMLFGWMWLNLGCGGRVMMVNDGTTSSWKSHSSYRPAKAMALSAGRML